MGSIIGNNGNINLVGVTMQDTVSGQCGGAIYNPQVSGTSTTSPYSVVWSGISNYSATTFNIFSLCEGEYQAVITDATGGTGTTNILISGYTNPTISARLTNDDCILDPNKKGTITIDSSTTTTSTYTYELSKDSVLKDSYYGSTADTSYTFSDIENGVYTVSVIEEKATQFSERPDKTGCTYTDYNDGGEYSGWTIANLFAKWESWLPRAYHTVTFGAGVGPAIGGGSGGNFDSGLGSNGRIYSNNPYVWFYTGSSATRKSDTTKNWYLGSSAYTIDEGDNIGPSGPTATAADVGYFYYNTVINKFLIWWNGLPGTTYGWLTWDPRVDYGIYGNPVACRALTGSTNGISNIDVDGNDYTVDSSGNVALASTVVNAAPSALRKFATPTTGNWNQIIGRTSLCSYMNYTWATSFNSTDSDDDTIGLILASFRDEYGTYGPTGVTHTLSLNFRGSTGAISILDNTTNTAYSNFYYSGNQFRDCRLSANCTTNPYISTKILENDGGTTPLSGANWDVMGSLRTKITRSGEMGEHFKIQLTHTMGPAGVVPAGGASGYIDAYEINLNLLDRLTWTGNTISAEPWIDDYAFCKYLGSRRIGFYASSQEAVSWYHMQFSGSPIQKYLSVPNCNKQRGPITSVIITATTATTLNISETKSQVPYTTNEPGVPQIRPKMNVSLQTMPNPSVTINGINRPYVTSTDTIGGVPDLNIYNLSNSGSCEVQFYFGGENDELIFGDAYPKFRIYPYLSETDEIATIPDYEAIFDTLPSYFDQTLQNTIVSASTTIPLSSLTQSSWQFIVKPTYLFKDKNSVADYWIDTATYPPSSKIDIKRDFYLVVVKNPATPDLYLGDFKYPANTVPSLYTQTFTIDGMPDAPGYVGPSVVKKAPGPYSAYTYTYTLRSGIFNRTGPLVYVNGILLTEGFSGTTTKPQTGDYNWLQPSRTIRFHAETVRNKDVVQVIYDTMGNSYVEFATLPDTVPTSSGETIYEADGYYYINLTKQSTGGVGLALNGVTQTVDTDFQQVSNRRIQLLRSTSDYVSGDTFAIFYRTIYQTISVAATKKPQVPIRYTKKYNLEEFIIIKLYNANGDQVDEQTIVVNPHEIGPINKMCYLEPSTFGNYTYEVLIKRAYPLINKDTIYTVSQSERIPFEISKSVFYTDNPFKREALGRVTPY